MSILDWLGFGAAPKSVEEAEPTPEKHVIHIAAPALPYIDPNPPMMQILYEMVRQDEQRPLPPDPYEGGSLPYADPPDVPEPTSQQEITMAETKKRVRTPKAKATAPTPRKRETPATPRKRASKVTPLEVTLRRDAFDRAQCISRGADLDSILVQAKTILKFMQTGD